MLDNLIAIEKILPGILRIDNIWDTLLVDYDYPNVERVWTQIGDFRVYLHRILLCPSDKSVLIHPHPWPSAVHVLEGEYEMVLSYGTTNVPVASPPKHVSTLILSAGSYYEMTDPKVWHSVKPLKTHSYSLMVTGLPYGESTRYAPGKKQNKTKLLDSDRSRIMSAFRKFYVERSQM